MKNAHHIKARLIVEAANGPITLKATKILSDRGILVVPDVLAGAGEVTVSYFEWVQNKQGYYWAEEEITKKLRQKILQSFKQTYELSKSRNVTMRLAGYMVGVKKIAEASQVRSWI